jgi:pimeloyl-ACP methyl ester carboxylesterase
MTANMQVVVDNLLTNYQLQGTGKLVLFLHGWGDSLVGSLALQKELASKYQVLSVDLPGFGKTQAPSSAWDLDNYSNFLTSLLTKLELGQPYAMIGHSNGGAVTIRAAALGAVNPEKIVLLAASGIRSGGSVRKTALKLLAKLGNAATIGMPERYRSALRKQLYKSAGSDMLVVEGMQETFKKTVKQDVQAEAAELTQPTLLVFAENDKAVPPFMAERYKSLIKNSELHMIADAGHFVHLDQPAQVTKLVKDFLA